MFHGLGDHYQKTYPLQVVMGELFGLSQSSANEWMRSPAAHLA
jgi:hypothetical protein